MADESKPTPRKTRCAEIPVGDESFSLIPNAKLHQLYETMLKCRMLERKARAFLRQGRKGRGDRSVERGMEAALVGVTLALERSDSITISHRGPIAALVKGESLGRIFRQVSASAEIPARDAAPTAKTRREPEAAETSQNVAAALQRAASLAQARRTREKGKVVTAFCTGISTSSEAWNDALKNAVDRSLPLLFVSVDQLRPMNVKGANAMRGAAARATATKVRSIPSVPVDGNDAVAVYRVAHEAIARARAGRGPTFIECIPYAVESAAQRGRGKATAGATGSRRGISTDPVRNMEDYLRRKGLFTPATRRRIAREFEERLDTAIQAAPRPRSGRGVKTGSRTGSTSLRKAIQISIPPSNS